MRIRATERKFMAKKIGQVDFKEVWTIPNIITYFRIICVPVFVTLMALGEPTFASACEASLFALAFTTPPYAFAWLYPR